MFKCIARLCLWGARIRLARCLSPLNSKWSPVGCGYNWMGDHLGIASCWSSKHLELMWGESAYLGRGGVCGHAPPLRTSETDTLLKMGFQTYIFCSKCRKCRFRDPNFKTFPGGMPPDLTTLICVLRNSACTSWMFTYKNISACNCATSFALKFIVQWNWNIVS